jgi:hypothetical protein
MQHLSYESLARDKVPKQSFAFKNWALKQNIVGQTIVGQTKHGRSNGHLVDRGESDAGGRRVVIREAVGQAIRVAVPKTNLETIFESSQINFLYMPTW